MGAAPPPPAPAGPVCSAHHPFSSPAGSGYGTVHFANSCAAAVQPALQLEIARLHSFESSTRAFERIAARDPGCVVALWGAAMSARGNPLGGSLDAKSASTGRRLIDRALASAAGTPRERGLVAAMDVYYRPYPDQIARARAYAVRMDALHAAFADDPDIAALDGLAIIEGVDLSDATHARQKRAGAILQAVMAAHPDHPGAPHYLIHAFDYAALAPQAVAAAEREAVVAPASSHAQHMPAHIWSMLGAWDRSIEANRRASLIADPTTAGDPVRGDIVFEHAFDFIAYARLQKGEDARVGSDLAAAKAGEGMPTVIVARYALERGDWTDAMRVPVPANDAFDAALARFARAYGAARAGHTASAATELAALRALRRPVAEGEGAYWAEFVDIYAEAAQAWLLEAEGRTDEALATMARAADRDDAHEKHIYLENKILPMREVLGDMQLALHRPAEALGSYRASLALAPRRYRSFLGAAQAAEAIGDTAAARRWAAELVALAGDGDKARPGWRYATAVIARP